MHVDIDQFLETLDKEEIKTWFDLGLFLDKLKDERKKAPHFATHRAFKKHIAKGTAFINYYLAIDGVTIENIKYAIALRKIFPSIKIHWIQDHIDSRQTHFAQDQITHDIKGIDGFDHWPPYLKLFHEKLERGSATYNELIVTIWKETLYIIKELLTYFNKNEITNMFITNVGCNPGQIALTLAIVIISEKLGMPVLSSNHDFYWEGGSAPSLRKKKGPRDHFFKNYEVGELFSIIQQLYPWDSDKWMQVNINHLQTKHCIKRRGVNPNTLMEITTSVEIEDYSRITDKQRKIILRKLNLLLLYTPLKKKIKDYAKPILLSVQKQTFNEETIIFLQPTRIIKRKRIERDILLFKQLLGKKTFLKHLSTRNCIFVITGPIATGNLPYCEMIIKEWKSLIDSLPLTVQKRLAIAFAFGKIKNKSFDTNVKKNDMTISEAYEIANFVLLPSKTEGRGLPLLESSAAYTPIIASRYVPITVYKHVVGEHLPKVEQIQTIEFPERINGAFVERIIQYLLDDALLKETTTQNRKVVQERFHFSNLEKDFEEAYSRLQENSSPVKTLPLVKKALKQYDSKQSGHYIPGFWHLEFMHYLKSLIDPSYFRVEEDELRGRIYFFCDKVLEFAPSHQKYKFYEALRTLFNYYTKQDKIIYDHSFAFRHRNTRHYPYRMFTEQELLGITCNLMQLVFGKRDFYESLRPTVEKRMFKLLLLEDMDWPHALKVLSMQFSIDRDLRARRFYKASFKKKIIFDKDDRKSFVTDVVNKPLHLLHFCGGLGELILEMSILGEKLLTSWSSSNKKYSVTFAAKRNRQGNQSTVDDIKRLLKDFLSSLSKIIFFLNEAL